MYEGEGAGRHDQGQASDDTNSEGKGAGRTDRGHDFVVGKSKGEGAGWSNMYNDEGAMFEAATSSWVCTRTRARGGRRR